MQEDTTNEKNFLVSGLKTAHKGYRALASIYDDRNVDSIRETLVNRNKKRTHTYDIGSLVRVRIPAEDRSKLDRNSLPAKVLGFDNHEKLIIGCNIGIIKQHFNSHELLPLEGDWPSLENISETIVTLREAARNQSIVKNSGVSCHCKSNCQDNRCKCFKAKVICTSKCHPSSRTNRNCSNNEVENDFNKKEED